MSRIDTRDTYTLLPDADTNYCFGCSQKNASGLQMKFYANKEFDLVVSWFSVRPQFCGWKNLAHGGILSTMLDEAMGWGALVILQRLILSKSIAVDFISPVLAGTEIRIEAGVREITNEREAVLQGWIYDGNNKLSTRSTSVASLFTMDYVRKAGLLDEAVLGDLERVMNLKSALPANGR